MEFGSHQFWSDFWPNFWSSIIVNGFLVFLVRLYISQRQKVDIKVITGGWISRRHGILPHYLVAFDVNNTGNVTFNSKEIRWFLITEKNPDTFIPRHTEMKFTTDSMWIEGAFYTVYQGVIDEPVFPGDNYYVGNVVFALDDQRQHSIYYYFSTAYGPLPKQIKDYTGHRPPPLKLMRKLRVRVDASSIQL